MIGYAGIKEILGKYEGKEMGNTGAASINKKIDFDASGLNRLVEQRNNSNEYHNSTLDDVKMLSKEYSLVVYKAKKYLKNAANSEEQRQNKALVQAALYRCLSAYSGSMRDKISYESVLDDTSIEIKTGEDDIDSSLSQDMLNVRMWPLFPWRPCIADIKQGRLGDCWLESALTCLVNKDPKYIEDSLRDNHDGTVTGRIYDKDEDNKSVKPRYYRVTKSIPHLSGTNSTISPAFSKNACLWPEMIRKILIKHIADKGGMDFDGTFVKEPTYRFLHSGNIANPKTEIFQFFCPNAIETILGTIPGLSTIQAVFKQPDRRGVFGPSQKWEIRSELIKYIVANYSYSELRKVIPKEDLVELDKLFEAITKSNYNGAYISRDSLRVLIQSNTMATERILSDKNILRLLSIKEIRKSLPSNIIKSLRQVLSEKIYRSMKKTFINCGGLMTVAESSDATVSGILQEINKEYGDILGKIEETESADGRYEPNIGGIYLDHAYAVLGLEEENGYYFVKIRNPWGYKQRYDYVTPDGKLKSKYDVDGDEGRIEILEFLKYFNYMGCIEP